MSSTRVLVADDLPHLALYLQYMLRKGGYESRVLNRGEELRAVLDDFKPAALLMNVEFSGHSGVDVCRVLRKEERYAKLCVVFITGNIFDVGAKEIEASCASGFLLKPVSPGALLAKLNELGLPPDMASTSKPGASSSLIMPFTDMDALSVLERFKIELSVGLAPLANVLRAGAFFDDDQNSGWLVRPDGCAWSAPNEPLLSEIKLHIKLERVALIGAVHCTIHLCSDAEGPAAAAALKVFSALVRQIQRVVEFGKQREDLFDELGLDHECLTSIYEISTEGQLLRKPEQAFEKIVKRTARALSVGGPVALALWIFNAETGLLNAARCQGCAPPATRMPSGGWVGACFSEQRSALLNAAEPLAPATLPGVAEPEFTGARHIAVVPVKGPNGMLGAMAAWHGGAWNFDSRHVRLLEAMAAQTATVIENELLLKRTIDSEIRVRELAIGAKIQEGLLFGSPPGEGPDFEFGMYADPSQQIGGDFFEFFRYGSSCDIVIGDVMGKGVPAALVGAAVKGQFLRYAREQRGDASGEPRNIVASVQREVGARLISLECFITVCYARFDATSRTMTYVDCGHPRPLHYRADTGEVTALECDWPRLVNIPLGTHPQASYEQSSVEMHPGDVFLFYSDGFTEAVGADGALFGDGALAHLLLKNNARHAEEITARIKAALKNFIKSDAMRDDLTCIVVKVLDSDVRREGSSDTLEIDARADQLPRLRAFLQVKCENIPYFKQEEQQLYNLQLAVTEAATNIVKYAYKDMPPGKIRIELSADHHQVEIKLFDSGVAFDPKTVREPSAEGFQESGRGVHMIKSFMDKVHYLRDAHNVNCMHMVKIIERRRTRIFE